MDHDTGLREWRCRAHPVGEFVAAQPLLAGLPARRPIRDLSVMSVGWLRSGFWLGGVGSVRVTTPNTWSRLMRYIPAPLGATASAPDSAARLGTPTRGVVEVT